MAGVSPALDASVYQAALLKLLPQGDLWPQDPESVVHRLFGALAEEPARVDARARDLRRESLWSLCEELLPDWEQMAGLPDPCAVIPETLEERRAALVAHMAQNLAPTPANIEALVLELTGVEVEVIELEHPLVTGDCNMHLWGPDWMHSFYVHAGETTMVIADCNSPCTAPLRSWGNPSVQCVVDRIKPAHTRARVTYEIVE